MSNCSFCGEKENKKTPLCQSCGSLRYPIAKDYAVREESKHKKLKLSATLALAVFTPGSFIFLALAGARKLNSKLKDDNKKTLNL